MFHYDITQELKINTLLIKKADNMCTNGASILKTDTSNNNCELSIEHNEKSIPLTPEQIKAKQSAKKRALDDIEKAKRVNKTITETEKTDHGTCTIETKYDALGNEEKRTVKREDGSICSIDEFNNGIISKTQMFFSNGAIASDIEYNNQGKPLRKRSYSPDPNELGKIEDTIEYEYYENGNLKSKHNIGGLIENEESYYENGNPKYKRNMMQYKEYNEKGQLIKSGTINRKTGEDKNTTLYEYDDLGRVIKESDYTYAEGELCDDGTIEISYEGNITKSVIKNPTGQVKRIITEETLTNGSNRACVYSPDGVLRTEQITSFDETKGLLSSKTIIFDKTGQMIGFTTSNDIELTEDGEIYIDTVDKYFNAKGEIISEEEYIKLKSEKRDDFKY